MSLAARIARCFSVSVCTTVLSLTILAVLAGAFGVTPWIANVIATAIGTWPSYVLNRRWVWRRSGASDPLREVAPFWVMSFSGLVLSTVAVDRAARFADHLALDSTMRTGALLAANVTAFSVLWVAQFVLLDRVLFGRPLAETDGADPPPSDAVVSARG